jgi:hypothetical protein
LAQKKMVNSESFIFFSFFNCNLWCSSANWNLLLEYPLWITFRNLHSTLYSESTSRLINSEFGTIHLEFWME